MKRLFFIGLAVLLAQNLIAQTKVFFSQQGGFYEESFPLEMWCSDGFHIRYTINGSTPADDAELYSEPLSLNKELYSKSDIYKIQTAIDELFFAPDSVQHCITLRAAAFDASGNRVGPVETQSYFIRSLGCDTHGLPVMVLSADSSVLFDYATGLFVPGANFNPDDPLWTGNFYESGREWERMVNVEFYEPDDNSGINQQAGLRMHGGTTRRQTQKGMKIYAREEYGTKRFRHKFFASIPNESFKHLVLKPFSYQWFDFGIQDDITNRMAATLDVESVASRPMVLFINGEYWGIYYLKEKPDAHYLEDHFDQDDTDYNVVGNWYGSSVDGDTTGFIDMMRWMGETDFSEEENYAQISQRIDISSFIDYYCLELFIANKDWPANNMRCYQLSDGKWRWIFFDGDDALRDMEFDVLDNATSILNIGWPTDSRSTLMFRKLLENNDFRNRFLLRFNELLSTQFSYSTTRAYYLDAAAIVREEMQAQADRFNKPGSPYGWENVITVVDDFLKNRVADMRGRLYDFFYVDNSVLNINEIYPNPSIGDVHVVLQSEVATMNSIDVYDMLGRHVMHSLVVLQEGENDVKLNKHFASGIYVVKFGSQIKRFVIQ